MFSSLKNQNDFAIINKFGKKYYTPYFLLVTLRNFEPKNKISNKHYFLYLGIKASKKLGKAHTRNKIKRRIRHIIRDRIKAFNPKQGSVGIIIVPKIGFEKVKFNLLCAEFEKIDFFRNSLASNWINYLSL